MYTPVKPSPPSRKWAYPSLQRVSSRPSVVHSSWPTSTYCHPWPPDNHRFAFCQYRLVCNFYIHGITQYELSFCLTSSLSVISLRFTHVAACNNSWFFFYCWVVFNCMDTTQFMYPFTCDGHLSCLQFRATTNRSAVNICVQVAVWICAFISLG